MIVDEKAGEIVETIIGTRTKNGNLKIVERIVGTRTVKSAKWASQQRWRRWLILWAVLLLLASAALFVRVSWLQAKAVLAQQLIEQAWDLTLSGERQVRPWPWAETWPVARLVLPEGQSLYVLQDVSGASLAFGPGMIPQSSMAGVPGSMAIAGHQDSHFRWLEGLALGDTLHVEINTGTIFGYQIKHIEVVNSRQHTLSLDANTDELILITCHPFGGPAGTPYRYIIHANRF